MSLFSILCNGTLLTTFDAIGVGPTFLAYGGCYVVCCGLIYCGLPETGAEIGAETGGETGGKETGREGE